MIKIYSCLFALAACLLLAAPAAAQSASGIAQAQGRAVAAACLGKWESAGCIKTLGESNWHFAARYAETLKEKGGVNMADQVVEHCAASTAAREQSVPAYAMRSAMTECVNTVYDISERSNVKPDLSHYQLLVSAVLCLSADPRCAAVEQGMQAR